MCGFVVNRKQKNSEKCLKQPSLTYLKMRYETSKYFDGKFDQSSELSRFDNLKMLIREEDKIKLRNL